MRRAFAWFLLLSCPPACAACATTSGGDGGDGGATGLDAGDAAAPRAPSVHRASAAACASTGAGGSGDACTADGDCAAGDVCTCAAKAGANACLPAACVTDADCAPPKGSGYCSPSDDPTQTASGLAGWFCHTPKDACTDDTDCKDDRVPVCAFDPSEGLWVCLPVTTPP